MSVERIVFVIAGVVVMLSVALGHPDSPLFHSTNWLWLTGFVGLNLVQSAFTGFCPAAIVLKKLGVQPGTAFQ